MSRCPREKTQSERGGERDRREERRGDRDWRARDGKDSHKNSGHFVMKGRVISRLIF